MRDRGRAAPGPRDPARFGRDAPWLLWPVHGALIGNFMRFCPGLTHRIAAAATPLADGRVLRRPEIRALLVASVEQTTPKTYP